MNIFSEFKYGHYLWDDPILYWIDSGLLVSWFCYQIYPLGDESSSIASINLKNPLLLTLSEFLNFMKVMKTLKCH